MYDPKVLAGLRASALNRRGVAKKASGTIRSAGGLGGSKRALRRGR